MKGFLLIVLFTQISRHLAQNSTTCTEGTLTPGPGRCTYYYKCVQNRYVQYSCSLGYRFDPVRRQCDWFWRVNCDTQCEAGRAYRSTTSCTEYYDCVDGFFQKRECNSTNGFGFDGNGCSNNYACPLDKNFPTAFPCQVENQVTPGSRCSSYYKCIGAFKKENTCPLGRRFNVKTLQCDWMWRVECGRQCRDDSLYTDSVDCRNYYTCSNGMYQSHDCGTDKGFNGTGCSDTFDCPVRSLPKATRCQSEGEKTPVAGSCSSYNECVNGFEMEESCVVGRRFNPDKNRCDWFWNVDCNEQDIGMSNSINVQY